MNIVSETVIMNQTRAIQILDENPCNRPLTQAHVNTLAREMKSGDWRLTGQEIQISSKNTLIDGQHRLWAVVESGVEVPMRVGRGYDPAIIKVLDTTVKKRSFGEVLHMEGYENYNTLAALLRAAYKFLPDGTYTSASSSSTPTMPELLRMMARFPNARKWAQIVGSMVRNKNPMSGAQLGAMGLLLEEAEASVMTAEDFVHALTSGAGLPEGSPILALRNILTGRRMSPNLPRFRSRDIYHMTIKAWNKVCRGDHVKVLTTHMDKEFPLIDGLEVYFDPAWTGDA